MYKEIPILKIDIDKEGAFLERPNRFIAHVKIDNSNEVIAHVHDSGRIKELLYVGNKVKLRKAKDMSTRKTQWDLISATSETGEDILINSSFHRKITDIIFNNPEISPFGKIDFIKPEKKYGNSRLDYYIEKGDEKIWVETKGVSLAIDNCAYFPDAPSVRATKHLRELMEIKKSGERAAVILIVLRDSKEFKPKEDTDPIFAKTFYEAIKEGVEIYPIQLKFKDGVIFWTNKEIALTYNEVDNC